MGKNKYDSFLDQNFHNTGEGASLLKFRIVGFFAILNQKNGDYIRLGLSFPKTIIPVFTPVCAQSGVITTTAQSQL